VKLPLANTLRNRTHQTSKDARLLNAFAETKSGAVKVFKRPSIVAAFEALEAGAGFGQGLFVFTAPDPTTVSGDGGDGEGGGGGFGGTSGKTEVLVGIQNDVLNNSPVSVKYKLAFSVQPVNWKILTAMSPAVKVEARDAFGTLMTGASGTVTISLYSNPAGGTLSGTLSAALSGGIATFSNLILDTAGGGYRLQATSTGLLSATSNSFKIISYLAFTVQPTDSAPLTVFSPSVKVSVVDSASAVITAYSGNGYDILMEITPGSPSAILSGDERQEALNGVATFANLSINNEGDGYQLTASADVVGVGASGLADVVSDLFNIEEPTHTVIAATNGFDYGFAPALSGSSINPTTYSGSTIEGIFYAFASGIVVVMDGIHAQDFFASVTFNGVTLLSASADQFQQLGDSTQWEWFGGNVFFPSTGTYPGTIE